jgi:hypothetical protein
MIDILGLLNSIGLAPQAFVPLIIVALAGYIILSKKLNKIVNPIRDAIIEIQTILSDMGKNLRYSLTEKATSPLSPTDYGLQMYSESGLKKFVQENTAKLLKLLTQRLESLKQPTAYDVQEKCIDVFTKDLINDPLIGHVKTYAFNKGLDVVVILRIGALLFRDEYLTKYSNLK